MANANEFKLEVLKKYFNYGLIFRDDVIEFSIVPPLDDIFELAKQYNTKVEIGKDCMFTNFCIKITS